MKISILTPSNRNILGLKIIERALNHQRFIQSDYEWLIGSPKLPSEINLKYKWIKDPEKKLNDVWVLNKLMNEMIKQAKGELIVSVQDFTLFTPDALSKFWFHYKNNPTGCVSGVGNKYSNENFTEQVWQDPREIKNDFSFIEVNFKDWEGNFAAIPKQAILDVGGFDEEMDCVYGLDWYSVNYRAAKLGYKYYLDQSNKSYSLHHDRYTGWEENNALNGYFNKRIKYYSKKNYNLRYLS